MPDLAAFRAASPWPRNTYSNNWKGKAYPAHAADEESKVAWTFTRVAESSIKINMPLTAEHGEGRTNTNRVDEGTKIQDSRGQQQCESTPVCGPSFKSIDGCQSSKLRRAEVGWNQNSRRWYLNIPRWAICWIHSSGWVLPSRTKSIGQAEGGCFLKSTTKRASRWAATSDAATSYMRINEIGDPLISTLFSNMPQHPDVGCQLQNVDVGSSTPLPRALLLPAQTHQKVVGQNIFQAISSQVQTNAGFNHSIQMLLVEVCKSPS